MARIVGIGSLKQRPRANNSSERAASALPRIQITQMTIDETTTDDERTPERRHTGEQGGEAGVALTQMKTSTATTTTILADEAATTSPFVFPPKEQKQPQNETLLSADKYQDRTSLNRQSTGTLNRLILVAQALENEVDWRRRNDVNSSRVVFMLRMANIVLLLLVNLLIFTGVGQYQDKSGMRISLLLTMDKWYFRHGYTFDELPATFSEIRLTGQFCAAALAVAMLLSTVLVQCIHCLRVRHSKMLCIFYAFACVPVALFIFGLEMHYSACPWLEDFIQTHSMRRNFASMEKYLFDTQCGVNGWALAGIFSLLSCGLFISDGLICTFFRSDDSHGAEPEKPEVV